MSRRTTARAPRAPHTARTRRLAARAGAASAAAALALTLAACGGSGDGADGEQGAESESPADVSGGTDPDAGTVLDQPYAKPELTLTDTEGEPYDFVAETEGKATLLYFGYTHCPDVCPLTMSNIALAASELTPEQRAELEVVFVTSDPERDTPAELGSWLDAQDPEFTGLTGDFETIQEAAGTLGVHLDPPHEDENGEIVSTHGTQVIAFLPDDNLGHVVYTEGVTADTFTADLPTLLAGETP